MKIVITSEEFIDIMFSLLLDKMVRPDEVLPDCERFNDINKIMEKKGLRPDFFRYYLDLNAYDRINYKRIKKSFEKHENNIIEIMNNKKLNESVDIDNNFYYIKTVIKKVVKILKQRKWLKGKITTEEMLDRIINDVMEKEKQ